jgi:hypothetical protein
MPSIGDLAIILRADATQFNKTLAEASTRSQNFAKDIVQDFSRMEDGLAKQARSMTPGFLSQKVRLDLAKQKQDAQYQQAYDAERNKQLGISTGAKDAVSSGSLGLRDLFKGFTEGGQGFRDQLKQAGGGSMLGGVGKALSGSGGFAGMVGMASSAMGAMVGPVGMAVTAMKTLVLGFKSLGDSIAGFVGMYSPAHAERWKMAWDDLSAAIGRDLLPALEAMTRAVRNVGDKVAKEGLGTTYLKTLGKNLVSAGIWGTYDLLKEDPDSKGASLNMAARQVSLTTDMGDIGRQNLIAAYREAGVGKKPDEATATKQQEQINTLNRIADILALSSPASYLAREALR